MKVLIVILLYLSLTCAEQLFNNCTTCGSGVYNGCSSSQPCMFGSLFEVTHPLGIEITSLGRLLYPSSTGLAIPVQIWYNGKGVTSNILIAEITVPQSSGDGYHFVGISPVVLPQGEYLILVEEGMPFSGSFSQSGWVFDLASNSEIIYKRSVMRFGMTKTSLARVVDITNGASGSCWTIDFCGIGPNFQYNPVQPTSSTSSATTTSSSMSSVSTMSSASSVSSVSTMSSSVSSVSTMSSVSSVSTMSSVSSVSTMSSTLFTQTMDFSYNTVTDYRIVPGESTGKRLVRTMLFIVVSLFLVIIVGVVVVILLVRRKRRDFVVPLETYPPKDGSYGRVPVIIGTPKNAPENSPQNSQYNNFSNVSDKSIYNNFDDILGTDKRPDMPNTYSDGLIYSNLSGIHTGSEYGNVHSDMSTEEIVENLARDLTENV